MQRFLSAAEPRVRVLGGTRWVSKVDIVPCHYAVGHMRRVQHGELQHAHAAVCVCVVFVLCLCCVCVMSSVYCLCCACAVFVLCRVFIEKAAISLSGAYLDLEVDGVATMLCLGSTKSMVHAAHPGAH